MGVKRRQLSHESRKSLVVRKFRVRMIKEYKCPLNLVDGIRTNECETMSLKTGDIYAEKNHEICIKSGETESVRRLEGYRIQCDNSDEVAAQCEFCGKQYKNDRRLKDHLRFCHPKVYHKCIICSQQFPKKWILNTHMRKHTGEFPYSCSCCGQKFPSNSKLQTHSNFHHKQEELSCKICKAFGFYTRQDLGNHIRTKHTKERAFKCDICEKSFMSSGVFYQHRFIHKSVKKYKCKICLKSFQRCLTLRNHLRIHGNELPFSCDICRQAFRQQGDVKKHKMSQHSNLQV